MIKKIFAYFSVISITSLFLITFQLKVHNVQAAIQCPFVIAPTITEQSQNEFSESNYDVLDPYAIILPPPDCDDNPSGDINLPVGGFNTTTNFQYNVVKNGYYTFRIYSGTGGYYSLNIDSFNDMSINITNSNSQTIASKFGNNLTFNELRFEPYSSYYVKISTRENSGTIYFSLFHDDFSKG